MKTAMKTIAEYLILLVIGGTVYYLMECCWRGYSHWTMFLLGGICFISIGLLNQFYLTWNMNVFFQMLLGSVIITVLEFITGCIVNLGLGWNVWDYSDMPLNILGQVCIPFMLLWFVISFIAILVDDLIRHYMFGEEKPHYYMVKRKE